jgi:adenine-specific DNA-methyltransferase
VVARDLLTETGSVFVQIGDENVHLLRCVLDEVFGSENFMSLITVKKTGGLGGNELKKVADYIVWYSRAVEHVKYRPLYIDKEAGVGAGTGERYDQVELKDGTRRSMTTTEREDPKELPWVSPIQIGQSEIWRVS